MALFPGEPVPEVIGVPCCSQFAVSREAIRARGKEEYVRMREWLLKSPLDAGTSGRIFEYLWHSMWILICFINRMVNANVCCSYVWKDCAVLSRCCGVLL